MKKINLKPYHGIILFCVHIAVFISVSAWMQYHWGMIGLLLTEVIILLFAVVPVFLTKNSLKEVFPLKKITLRQLFAILIFWFASFIINAVIGLLIQLFISEQYMENNQVLTEMFNSVPFILSFFIVAVMPAVCEEAMHRGFIQYTMRNIKSKCLIVLIMGVIFGIFHLDPFRFLGTAILGALLSYLMLETGNFLIPVMFHLLNNAVSVTVSRLYSTNLQAAAADMTLPTISLLSALGIYLIIGAATPFLFVAGSRLLQDKVHNQEKKPTRKKTYIIAAIISIFLFLSGIGFFLATGIHAITREVIIDMSGGFVADTEETYFSFDVPESSVYMMSLDFESEGFLTDLQVVSADGETIFQNISDGFSVLYNPLVLDAGEYSILLRYIKDEAEVEPYIEEMGYTTLLSDTETMTELTDVFKNPTEDYAYYLRVVIQ